MQLEVGKFYKDKRGNKVNIVHRQDDCFISYDSLEKVANTFESDGTGLFGAPRIIEEWVESVVHRMKVTVSKDGLFVANILKQYQASLTDHANTIQIEIDMSKPAGQRVREIVEGGHGNV